MKKLTVLLINVHGLFRGNTLELGRNADTGGQTKYVLEYARELGGVESIGNVFVFTRKIVDRRFSEDYSRDLEKVSENVNIIRVGCGGNRYIRKEKLWPHLDEFVSNCIKFLKANGIQPDIIHSHYADAGYVAMELSKLLNIPFIHTGHSLGIPKKMKLLDAGMDEGKIDSEYSMERRIEVENRILEKATFIVTSTNQEIEEQYSLYENYEKGSFRVTPPGVDLEKFFPYYYIDQPSLVDEEEREKCLQARIRIRQELDRFLVNPEKPLILAICRPETRKNIEGLITAYGNDPELQSIANLAIVAGIRKDITEKEKAERSILTDMLLLMDKFNLYGKLAIPKKHEIDYEVPEYYRYTASLRGVFVNPAFIEPFGLTLLEAASSGLPIVATDNGGPKDIVKNCGNGLLVDVKKSENIASTVKKILVEPEEWQEFSNNGIINTKKHYSWKAHCTTFIEYLEEQGLLNLEKKSSKQSINKTMAGFRKFLITDIDNTLLGNRNYLDQLGQILKNNRQHLGFGVATGRNIESALEVLQDNRVPLPRVLITSVGTEIYYCLKDQLVYDKGYEAHINDKWEPFLIRSLLEPLPFLEIQLDLRKYKISFYIDEYSEEKIREIHEVLRKQKCRYNLIVAEQKMIDILPYRASKSNAIKYFAYKWDVYEDDIMVCGDSGNDYEMLRDFRNSVVVANHQKELEGHKDLFYSNYPNAGAIIEGIEKYNFLEGVL